MNGINKTIMGVVSSIALVYSGLCLFLTLRMYISGEGNPIHFYLLFPTDLSNINLDTLGFDITTTMMSVIPGLYQSIGDVGIFQWMYDSIFEFVPNLDPGIIQYCVMGMLIAGFALAAAGFVIKASSDCSGQTNPAEYLWTHRPNAFLRCLAMPWGILVGSWKKNRLLVVIPILLLFLYAPWAVMISAALVIPFLVARLIIGSRINGAAKKESIEYQKNTDYGICPHCKMSFERPKVKCRCGLVLDYPVPNIYGYEVHYCNKGHEIPCTSGKRANLTTICPFCSKQIDTREARPITISLVGGTGTGKTSLMLSAVDTMIRNARTVDVTVESPSSGLSKEALAAKDYAPKTLPGETESQIVFLRSLRLQDREIVFNDVSGVEFQPAVDKVLFEEYYNYTDGFIFTFDPLALKREHLREAPHEVFDSFHYMYTTIRGIGPSVMSDTPFAVVATKNDLMRPKLKDDDVRQYLIDNGEENFVAVVESLFKEVMYFAVTAHGSECGSSMSPVWWIVRHVDTELTRLVPSE